jgi:hypothetical protein
MAFSQSAEGNFNAGAQRCEGARDFIIGFEGYIY